MAENKQSAAMAPHRILVSTCYGHFLSHFNMLAFPALLIPLSERVNLSVADTLNLSFGMYLLFGLSALPWGLAGDRWGAKRFLRLFYVGAGSCAVAAALTIDVPWLFSLFLAGVGLFSGIYHPIGLGIVSKAIERVSMGMAFNGMFGNLGLASAPLLVGAVNWLFGASAAYLFVGLVNLGGLLLMTLFPFQDTVVRKTEPDKGVPSGISPFMVLLIAMMLGGIVYRGATVITPAYFELKNQSIYNLFTSVFGSGISANLTATAVTSLIFLIGMAGQYSGGRLGEIIPLKYGYLLYHALTIPLAVGIAMTGNWPLVLLATVYFFFLLGMQPLENTLVARLTPQKLHHSAFGMKFVLTFGVGALAVKAVGLVESHWDMSSVYYMLAGVSVLLVVSILVLIRVLRTKASKAAPAEAHVPQ
jgi:MFS family permease